MRVNSSGSPALELERPRWRTHRKLQEADGNRPSSCEPQGKHRRRCRGFRHPSARRVEERPSLPCRDHEARGRSRAARARSNFAIRRSARRDSAMVCGADKKNLMQSEPMDGSNPSRAARLGSGAIDLACTSPKSESSGVPSRRKKTLEGVTSRCTRPALCSSPSARAIAIPMRQTKSGQVSPRALALALRQGPWRRAARHRSRSRREKPDEALVRAARARTRTSSSSGASRAAEELRVRERGRSVCWSGPARVRGANEAPGTAEAPLVRELPFESKK